MKNKIEWLLDSGSYYGLIDETDSFHDSIMLAMRDFRDDVILPAPVVTEIAYLIKRQNGVEALANFLDVLSATTFQIEMPLSTDFARSAEIIRQYDDANVDFVDALIVAMAERLEITRILTIDQRHFRMFRPVHCDAFEILP